MTLRTMASTSLRRSGSTARPCLALTQAVRCFTEAALRQHAGYAGADVLHLDFFSCREREACI